MDAPKNLLLRICNREGASDIVLHAEAPAFLNSSWPVRTRPTQIRLLPHLLSIVDEGIVGVDKDDVLRLQVSVSQLVVMENCW